MPHFLEIVLTIFGSVAASSGFWAFIQSKHDKKNGTITLLRGMAHNAIIDNGMKYIDRGWVTKDEYEDFMKYLYEPYDTLGGNGLAKKVFEMVSRLPMKNVGIKETMKIDSQNSNK